MAQLEQLRITFRGAPFIDARRATGQDQALGVVLA